MERKKISYFILAVVIVLVGAYFLLNSDLFDKKAEKFDPTIAEKTITGLFDSKFKTTSSGYFTTKGIDCKSSSTTDCTKEVELNFNGQKTKLVVELKKTNNYYPDDCDLKTSCKDQVVFTYDYSIKIGDKVLKSGNAGYYSKADSIDFEGFVIGDYVGILTSNSTIGSHVIYLDIYKSNGDEAFKNILINSSSVGIENHDNKSFTLTPNSISFWAFRCNSKGDTAVASYNFKLNDGVLKNETKEFDENPELSGGEVRCEYAK